MKSATLIAGAATLALAISATAWAAQQPAAPAARPAPQPTPWEGVPLPANLSDIRIAGSGLNVDNLEGMKAWYMTTLGLKLKTTYNGANGAINEYALAFSMDDAAPAVVLLKAARQPGATSYGRLVLQVKDSAALAAHLNAHGIRATNVAPGAFFTSDPEGNRIELYTPPPAKP